MKSTFFTIILFAVVFSYSQIFAQETYTHKFDCKIDRTNGADNVFIVVDVLDDDTEKCYLIGIKNEKEIWKNEIPIGYAYGWGDRCFINCTGDTIEIGFLHAVGEYIYLFKWDGKQVTKIDFREVNHIAYIPKAIEKAISGNGVDWELDKMYLDKYISSYDIEDLLKRGHKKSLIHFREKKLNEAIKVLTDVCDLSFVLTSFLGHNEEYYEPDAKLSEKIPLWTSHWQYIESSVFIPLLNDLGFFLQENKEYQKSISVFKEVLKLNPNRMVAHLNIADSYWENEQIVLAREHYNKYHKYYSFMKEQESKIPSRVIERKN